MKIKYYFSMIMAALVMTNCSQEEELQDIQQYGDVHTLTATIEGGSRSAVTDGGVFSWTSGDAISVWNGSNKVEYTYSGTGNKFTGTATQISGYAVYPDGEHSNLSGSNLPTVNLKSTYNYGSTNAIMMAKVQSGSPTLSFSHLGGLMRFTIKNIPNDATSFTFTANTSITGNFQVTPVSGENVINTATGSSNKTVTINFTKNNLSNGTGTFYVPLPVGTYTGFTIAIGGQKYVSSATNTINRRTLLLMPTFTCSGTQLVKGENSFKLENAEQEMNVGGNESLLIETPASGTNAQLNLNYTPENNNSTLNISDGQTGDSKNSKAKVVVNVTNKQAVSELNINAPTLTVELSSGTYDEITAKTATKTLIIKKGVKVKSLKVIGGKVEIEDGAKVENQTELRVLTFEDGTEGFEPYDCTFTYSMSMFEETKYIKKWSDYIPTDGQYGNGHGAYEWYDEGNTELAFVKPEIESWWGISGHAGISNYVGSDEDIERYHDNDNMLFMIDLQAYNVEGGANGSKNFCSQYGYMDPEEYATDYSPTGVLPGIQFGDGVPRVIDHMYVTNTTYAYGIIVRGECDFGGSYEYTNKSTFKIVAYGYDSFDDTEPTTTEFYLLNTGKRIVTDWKKWDLSVLGKVVRVEFNLVACYEGYGKYGLVIPAYFAYDDVAVQFEK